MENTTFSIRKIDHIIMFSGKEAPAHLKYDGCLPHNELVLYTSGDVRTLFAGADFHNKEGSLEFLPCGLAGTKYEVFRTEPSTCIDIYFDGEAPRVPLQWQNTGSRIREWFIRAHTLWRTRPVGYANDCTALVYRVLAEIERQEQAAYTGTRVLEKLLPAEEAIAARCFDPGFEVGNLHELCGVSYTYFKHLFLTKHGIPPSVYVTDLRMRLAEELLQSGRYSVTEVSEACGYSNISYFSRVFKQHFGCSPAGRRATPAP